MEPPTFLILIPLLLVLLVAAPLCLLAWAVNPESRLPSTLEAVAPLKGRWLRYLLGALCLPLALLLPFVVVFVLMALPPVLGFTIMMGVVTFWMIRNTTSWEVPRNGEVVDSAGVTTDRAGPMTT